MYTSSGKSSCQFLYFASSHRVEGSGTECSERSRTHTGSSTPGDDGGVQSTSVESVRPSSERELSRGGETYGGGAEDGSTPIVNGYVQSTSENNCTQACANTPHSQMHETVNGNHIES